MASGRMCSAPPEREPGRSLVGDAPVRRIMSNSSGRVMGVYQAEVGVGL